MSSRAPQVSTSRPPGTERLNAPQRLIGQNAITRLRLFQKKPRKPALKCATFVSCFLLYFFGQVTPAFAFQTTIILGQTEGRAVNRNILGNNIQWIDQGDGLVDRHGAVNSALIQLFEPDGIPTLRFPGGSLSDSYHWADGVGRQGNRPTGRDLSNRQKPNVFGTDEFLQLARRLGATPVITANVSSGTADEAAAWVSYTKETAAARGLPKVQYWEIGNEPYLKETARPDLAVAPGEFIRRFNRFATAMRQADPTIKVGLPLRTDRINQIPVSAYPGFNQAVLAGLQVPIDFAALHYYFPFANDRSYSDIDMYWAAMAAPETMRKDLARTSAALRQQLKVDIPLAVTEYNAMFSLGRPATDGHIGTLAAGLLIADMLRVFTETPSVAFANYWSMSGNWHFGMVGPDLVPRPSHHVFDLYSTLLRGHHLPIKVNAPPFNAPSVGLVPATANLPLVTAIATRENRTTRLLVINKSLTETADLTIALEAANSDAHKLTIQLMTGASALAGGIGQPPIQIRQVRMDASQGQRRFALPAHSIALFELVPN